MLRLQDIQRWLLTASRALSVVALVVSACMTNASAAETGLILKHGGHTYKLMVTASSWAEAKASAESMSLGGSPGYLAVIDSDAENAALLGAALGFLNAEQLAETVATDGSNTPFVWLGGTDQAQEGRWIWVNDGEQFWQGDFNGSASNGRYTNWGIQPDSASPDEDAVAMSLGDWPEPFFDLGAAGEWNDLSLSDTLYYWVEFDKQSDLRLALEEPVANTIYSGIGSIRGWALSSDPITRISVYVDGEYQFDVPHVGYRADVGAAFEDVPGSDLSGFANAVNYNLLGRGAHNLTIRATDKFGSSITRRVDFSVTRFQKAFLRKADLVELGWSNISALGDQINIEGAAVAGDVYNIVLKWRPESQGFEIIEIVRTSNAQ